MKTLKQKLKTFNENDHRAGAVNLRQKGRNMKALTLENMMESFKQARTAEERLKVFTTFKNLFYMGYINHETYDNFLINLPL